MADVFAWKETVRKDEIPKNEELTSVEKLIKMIEKACSTGTFYFGLCFFDNFTEENIHTAFESFHNRRNELEQIRYLSIYSNLKHLCAAALLFETGAIEEVDIRMYETFDDQWPLIFENCHALKSIKIWSRRFQKGLMKEFPTWIRHAVSLRCLSIHNSEITYIPDWINEFQYLSHISLEDNCALKTLPEGIGDLKFLSNLSLRRNSVLKTLPDSLGKLNNLTVLDLFGSPIEKLPDSIMNLTALQYVDIFGTNIYTVPESVSSVNKFIDNKKIEFIPQESSISYHCFCNSYYRLAETILLFSEKTRHGGLLSLEDDLEYFSEDFFHSGVRLAVDGTEHDIIKHILTTRIEREHDYYRKKLMEIAMEGCLWIRAGFSSFHIAFLLATLVDIKDNPLDVACSKYLSGEWDAFSDINFKAAIQQEEEREEVRFIGRAIALSEVIRLDGLLALEKYLDYVGIAGRDVFEYGLPMVIDGWEFMDIDKILNNLISHESNPVRKNLALAKKDTIRLLQEGSNYLMLAATLSAYFDKAIAKEVNKKFLKE